MVWKAKLNKKKKKADYFWSKKVQAVLWESLTINHLLSPVIYLHCLLGRWCPRDFNLASQGFQGLLIISRILTKIYGEAKWTGRTECSNKPVALPEAESLTFFFFFLWLVCKMWIQLNPQTFCIFCSPVYLDEKVGGNEKKNMTTSLSYMIFFFQPIASL